MASGGRSSTAKSSKNKAKTTAVKKEKADNQSKTASSKPAAG